MLTIQQKKSKQKVVAQFDWAAVKERETDESGIVFDIWKWNLYKMKWVRMYNGRGFDRLEMAVAGAKEVSQETENMLSSNRRAPKPRHHYS